jgi:hypothetical protein
MTRPRNVPLSAGGVAAGAAPAAGAGTGAAGSLGGSDSSANGSAGCVVARPAAARVGSVGDVHGRARSSRPTPSTSPEMMNQRCFGRSMTRAAMTGCKRRQDAPIFGAPQSTAGAHRSVLATRMPIESSRCEGAYGNRSAVRRLLPSVPHDPPFAMRLAHAPATIGGAPDSDTASCDGA